MPTITILSDTHLTWHPRRWVWAVWALIPALAALPFARPVGTSTIFGEGMITEAMQGGMLLTASLAAAYITLLVPAPPTCRSRTALLGLVTLACAARELDWHAALNPETLGDLGVRFRTDWWLDPLVHWSIKALWAGAALAAGSLAGLLLRRALGPVDWRRARPRLVLAAAALYLIGFIFDDTLRPFLMKSVRQPVEELCELVAAACLLGAVLAPESAGEPHSPPRRAPQVPRHPGPARRFSPGP